MRAQQALHHNLVQLQQTTAGLASRKLLDDLYGEGTIDSHEYLTIRLASGADEVEARESLARAHATVKEVKEPLPPPELLEPGLPQYSGPKRVARRPPKKASELRGHPLD